MRLAAAIGGRLTEYMAAQARAGELAVTAGVAAATGTLKETYRRQVTAAGMGDRMAKTWRGEVYPKGKPSIGAAGLVFSRAPVIIEAHSENRVIRARNSRFLAIALPAAGRGRGGKRMTPEAFEAKTGLTLQFVPRPRGGGLLVASGVKITARGAVRSNIRRSKGAVYTSLRGATSVPVFVLVPQTTLRKVFDLSGPARDAAASIPGRVVAEWEARDGQRS